MGTPDQRAGNRLAAAARAERRAMLALVAVFVLFVQTLAPAAMARPDLAGIPGLPPGDMLLCTSHGPQTAPANDPAGERAPAAPCQHCVCPAHVSAPPPATATAAQAAFIRQAPLLALPAPGYPPARPSPRPPGQGPPAANA